MVYELDHEVAGLPGLGRRTGNPLLSGFTVPPSERDIRVVSGLLHASRGTHVLLLATIASDLLRDWHGAPALGTFVEEDVLYQQAGRYFVFSALGSDFFLARLREVWSVAFSANVILLSGTTFGLGYWFRSLSACPARGMVKCLQRHRSYPFLSAACHLAYSAEFLVVDAWNSARATKNYNAIRGALSKATSATPGRADHP